MNAGVGVVIVIPNAQGIVVSTDGGGVDWRRAVNRRGKRGDTMLCDCFCHKLSPS